MTMTFVIIFFAIRRREKRMKKIIKEEKGVYLHGPIFA
jgi:hypothetical protein